MEGGVVMFCLEMEMELLDMVGVCTGCKHSIVHPFQHAKYSTSD